MELRASSPSTIRVVLFDIGGVLVEPSGVATMLAWMRNSVSPEQLWRMRLTSSCVRAFETGRLSPEAFADQVIAEFGLPVPRERFLDEMTRRSVILFPGAMELVERIPRIRARDALQHQCDPLEVSNEERTTDQSLSASFRFPSDSQNQTRC
jgi:hypothetical protein